MEMVLKLEISTEARERCKWKAIRHKSEDVGRSWSVLMERMKRKKEQNKGNCVRRKRGKDRKIIKKAEEGSGGGGA